MRIFNIDYADIFDKVIYNYASLSSKLCKDKSFLPIRYNLELTYKCNLNCNYCYIGENKNINELTTEEWFNVIDQIPPFGLITLVGGEPLIKKDFDKIFDRAVKKHKVNIVSNATLLTDEHIKSFVKKKLTLIGVSIDGIGKKHDLNRNKPGIFDKITENLEKLKIAKGNKLYPLIDIKTLVLDNNLDDLPEIYKLASYFNADFLTLSFLRADNFLQNSSIKKEEFEKDFYNTVYPIKKYFDLEHFKKVYKQVKTLSKKGKTKLRLYPRFNDKNELDQIVRFYTMPENIDIKDIYYPCLHPWVNVSISPNGDVYPCLCYKVDNIRENSFKEIWNNSKYRKFRRYLSQEKVFKSCQACCQLRVKY
ncbi:MAG: radical SAM protein [Candidatus Gastranaerophilales bacterium]|nr:radical SAM protein [Candidatus Gastranaerophilales bacterium]